MPKNDLDSLVARCIEASERGAPDEIARICEAHPELAAEIRQRLDELEIAGLLASQRVERIGPYRILDVLGEGGMGTVYLAEQREPVRRRVALKVIKPGMDTKEVLNRFQAERQALAMMEHHSIARVFDAAATDAGRPYFAMEYVKGIPVTRYCDEHKLALQERLELFRQICSGVQHAHTKGVIHRDLKPSNVLVTAQDGEPRVKIIDFGLARATDHRLIEQTMFTRHGQLVGTPEYMSPEQAGLDGLDIDTRTDIYSLGVILYELLTGALPFDSSEFRQGDYLDIQRRIRDDEPARPSTRLSTLGADSDGVAAARRTTAASLVRDLRRDLDWIAMKALEKDRTRRYETASAFADDVGRFLASEPVAAGPPGIGYRVRKFARRYRGQVIAGSLVLLSLVAGIVGTVWFALSASDRADEAQRQQTIAEGEWTRAEKNAAEALRQTAEAERLRRAAEWQAHVASLQAGQAHVQANDVRSARSVLDACSADLRGFAWQHLWHGTDVSLARLPCDYRANHASFSRDGRRLAVATDRAMVCIWDTATWREAHTLLGHQSSVIAAHCTPDGGRIVTGSHDGTLRVWGADDLRELQVLRHRGGVSALAVSADGRLWASGGYDRAIRIWDAETMRELRVLRGHRGVVLTLAFSPDSKRLVSSGRGDGVRMWSLGEPATSTTFGLRAECHSAAFHPDGTLVALGLRNRRVELRDVATESLVHTLAHDGWVTALAFSADGDRLVTGDNAGHVRVFDATTGRLRALLRGHENPVWAIALSPSGSQFVSCSTDALRVWDAETHDHRHSILHFDALRDLAIGPDERRCATIDNRGRVLVWDLETGVLLRTMRGHGNGGVVLWTRDGRWIVSSGGTAGRITVWNSADGACRAVLRGHEADVLDLTELADGRIASASADTTVKIWDLESGASVRSFSFGANAESLASTPAGDQLAVGLRDGSIVVRAGAGPARTLRDPESPAVTALAFTPDGRTLISGSIDGALRLWDLEQGTCTDVLRGHARSVKSLAVSPDGALAASGSADRSVRLWDLRRRKGVLALRGHAHVVDGVAFVDGGKRLVSAGWDRTVQVRETELPPERLATRHAHRLASRAAERRLGDLRAGDLDAFARFVLGDPMAQAVPEPLRGEMLRQSRIDRNDAPAFATTAGDLVGTPAGGATAAERALRLARAAAILSPNGPARAAEGGALYRLGRLDEALEVLAQSERCDHWWLPTERARARLFASLCESGLGRRDAAERALREARALLKDADAGALAALLAEAAAALGR